MPTEQLTKCFEQLQKTRTGFVYKTNSVNIHSAMTVHFLSGYHTVGAAWSPEFIQFSSLIKGYIVF